MTEIQHMPDPLETRASLIHRLPDAADVRAWDEFAGIYAPLVYRLARRQSLQPADADDLVQEVLTAVSGSVEAWLQKSDRGRFRAWLFRIARNTTINFLTRRKHRPLGTGGHDDQQGLLELAADAAFDDFDIQYEREVFHWASLQVRDTVTEKTWQAFWRTTMEDQSASDAASELQMTVGSIYIARSRVMARLKSLVQQFEEREE